MTLLSLLFVKKIIIVLMIFCQYFDISSTSKSSFFFLYCNMQKALSRNHNDFRKFFVFLMHDWWFVVFFNFRWRDVVRKFFVFRLTLIITTRSWLTKFSHKRLFDWTKMFSNSFLIDEKYCLFDCVINRNLKLFHWK